MNPAPLSVYISLTPHPDRDMFSYNRYTLLEPTDFSNLITKRSFEEVTSLWSPPTLCGQPQFS